MFTLLFILFTWVLKFKRKKSKNGKIKMKLKLELLSFYVKWHYKLSVYINRFVNIFKNMILKIELLSGLIFFRLACIFFSSLFYQLIKSFFYVSKILLYFLGWWEVNISSWTEHNWHENINKWRRQTSLRQMNECIK